MRNFTLSILFIFIAFAGSATTWTINNSGFAFSPSTLTINEGDTVVFELAGEHNSVEVSQTTWNMNGNTPLSGGWVLPFGGGMVLPADLTVGTHWYVCQPHASGGMKGMIIVEETTSTDDTKVGPPFSFYPNPSQGVISLITPNSVTAKNLKVNVFDLSGNEVYTTTLSEQHTDVIDLTSMPKGVYMIHVYDDKGIRSRKLILQ